MSDLFANGGEKRGERFEVFSSDFSREILSCAVKVTANLGDLAIDLLGEDLGAGSEESIKEELLMEKTTVLLGGFVFHQTTRMAIERVHPVNDSPKGAGVEVELEGKGEPVLLVDR